MIDQDTATPVTAETPAVPYSALPTGIRAAVSALRFTALAVVELLTLVWALLVMSLSFAVVGLFLVPSTLDLLHSNAERQRRWAYLVSGVPVLSPAAFGDTHNPRGLSATIDRLRDRAVWREAIWHVVNPIVGLGLSILPFALMVDGVWGLVQLVVARISGAERPLGGWFGLPITDVTWWIVLIVAPLGIVIGYFIARPVLRVHGEWVRLVLGTDVPTELQAALVRVRRTRRSALDLQEAEIARIERDLHDGAQARMVAMGMTLSEAATLVRDDPKRAVALLESAKDHSAAALGELRGLVRGLRPPVLADRGLTDALRALAAQSPVRTTVTSHLDHRLAPSLEAALYFATSELHTNAVKHADASLISIQVHTDERVVTITVDDNGQGGASEAEAPGGGIAGIRRRIEPFDGILAISSPPGDGTVATLTAPAVLV